MGLLTGRIIKGVAGFYYVEVAGSGIYECRAKGLFRIRGLKPLVGDEVEIAVLDEKDKEANIETIRKRRSELGRPAVANVDQALIVMSLSDPKPSYTVLDKFLIQTEKRAIPAVLCFNKTDLVKESEVCDIAKVYKQAGYEVYLTSVVKGTGLSCLKNSLKLKTTVIAGPSGAGKSSIINWLAQDSIMQTGEVSVKLKRGRNTTRHSQLIAIDKDSYILDTPGFTSFETDEIDPGKLWLYYPELRKYEDRCRFAGCSHINEPDCAVKEAVKKGEVSGCRYDSYAGIYRDLKEREKNKYR